MQRSSPEASTGFRMFDASSEPPLVAPAPTTVWISSMKRIAPGILLQRLDHRLQALLEVAAEARAGEQRAHVERVDARALRATRAPCPGGSAAPGPRRSRSCRRRPRRRRAGCSCGGGRARGRCARARRSRPISGSILPSAARATRSTVKSAERVLLARAARSSPSSSSSSSLVRLALGDAALLGDLRDAVRDVADARRAA